MSEVKPYVGDIGTLIEVETETDLTGNATLQLDMVKPDGTEVSWTSSIKSGATSVAQYTIVSGDFDVAGVWYGQLYVSWDASNIWRGQTFSFELFAQGA